MADLHTSLEIIKKSSEFFVSRNIPNARRESEELLCRVFSCKRIDLYADFERVLNPLELKQMRQYISRRANGEPLQYILGDQPFRSAELKVDSRVLIPRPETEELVGLLLADIPTIRKNELSICDIGTGSGCIAISLAMELPPHLIRSQSPNPVVALDSSPDALILAAENAEINGVKDLIEFKRMNIIREKPGKPFDIIISNPPYVSPLDKSKLQNELNYEPQMALYDEIKNGLGFYLRFAEILPELLRENGRFYFEIGDTQAEAVLEMFQPISRNLKVQQDLAGRERFITGQRG
jgi:release factor glutamine methyltransferase